MLKSPKNVQIPNVSKKKQRIECGKLFFCIFASWYIKAKRRFCVEYQGIQKNEKENVTD